MGSTFFSVTSSFMLVSFPSSSGSIRMTVIYLFQYYWVSGFSGLCIAAWGLSSGVVCYCFPVSTGFKPDQTSLINFLFRLNLYLIKIIPTEYILSHSSLLDMNMTNIIFSENKNLINKEICIDLWLNLNASLEPDCLGIMLN